MIVRRTVVACAIVFCATVLAVAAVASAGGGVSVSGPVDVTNDVYANNEESLGMSPDGQFLAGAWNDWDLNDGLGFSYSTDGGAHWAPESFVPGMTNATNSVDVAPLVPSIFTIGADPAVAWNPKFNTFDVLGLALGTKSGNQAQTLATAFDPSKADPNADVNVSYGRAAWRLPASAVSTGTANGSQKGSKGKFPDHEAIAVDAGTGGKHHYGRLYTAWAEFNGFQRAPIDIAYSNDNGSSWTGPIRISDQGHQFDQDAKPVIGPDGTVYVSWINGPNERSVKDNVAMIAKSTDGGNTWSADQVAAPLPVPVGPIAESLLPNSQYSAFSTVQSVVDQRTGTVVLTFNEMSSGASQIWSTHTLAPGDITRWSAPTRVEPTGQEQFFPWLAAAPGGRIDLVFYDRSCDPSGDKLNCVTLASTRDSGKSWTTTSLLGQGFDGDKYSTCQEPADPQACGKKFIGDYIAVASNDRKAQALWTGNGPQGMDVFSGRATFSTP